MGKIHVLDANIANRIAAGEVVERPSGVVKELVENAIDAGSTRIEINIREGGISFIEIIDNGCGMNQEDASLAFERHATSKIRNDLDLWNIHTLGFRGEALPSIASVSEVEMFTCDGEDSAHIKINNGTVEVKERAPMRKGTTFVVRNLFYTIPARLKHLKSVQYETSQILDIIQKLALGNPNIAFVFRSDDKEMFRSSGNGDVKAVLNEMFGREVANSAIPVFAKDDDFTITGYACLPTQTRSSRKHILFFMNHRIVISYYLQAAIMNAYESYIPEKRFPIVCVDISMDASLVDVNVHPSKWEVRLSKEKQLFALLEQAVKEALASSMNQQASLITQKDLNREEQKVEIQTLFTEHKAPSYEFLIHSSTNKNKTFIQNDEKDKEIHAFRNENVETLENKVETKEKVVEKETQFVEKLNENVENKKSEAQKVSIDWIEITKKEETIDIIAPLENKTTAIDEAEIIPFEVIGQLHGSYILASNNDGLVIIDQHAANERIKYEKVKKAFENQAIEVQPLLLPYVIEIRSALMANIDSYIAPLKAIGIDVETFGEKEIIIREIPTWMNGIDNEEQFIIDLIDAASEEKTINVSLIKKHALATLACHSSIRFNATLTRYEMEETIRNLFKCENPYHCPHGRPTYIVYENSKLRKLFERG